MHDELPDDLDHAIDAMDDAEKLQLIERLARSMRASGNEDFDAQAVDRQHDSFRQLQDRLSKLPREKDPHSNLGYSNEAHDKILYDIEQK